MRTPSNRRAVASRTTKAQARSRVSNGRDVLPDVDGRSLVARRYRDIVSESHASAIETIVRTYRFDGSEYRLARCLSRAYYDDNGKPTKDPISRPCGEQPPKTK